MRKDWALVGIIVLILVVSLGLFVYLKNGKKKIVANPVPSSTEQGVVGTTTSAPYFSENAKVMYFYTDYCYWCIEEKKVLEELGKEGYQVKPMNIGEKQDLAKKYNITGTPTFLVEGGEQVEGYQTKEQLKSLLDKYK